MSPPESETRPNGGPSRPSPPPLKRVTPLGETTSNSQPPAKKKKTLGRVKIEMKYIDEKQKRMICFSKRKTGLMKKAYELSALTGTQVMLLVASETGHVYTFATKKLQPMITSEAGKTLIQTCLNTPDDEDGDKKSAAHQGRLLSTVNEPLEEPEAVDSEEDEEGESEGEGVHLPGSEEVGEGDRAPSVGDGKADEDDKKFDNVPTNGAQGSIVFRKLDVPSDSEGTEQHSAAPLPVIPPDPSLSTVIYSSPRANLRSGMPNLIPVSNFILSGTSLLPGRPPPSG